MRTTQLIHSTYQKLVILLSFSLLILTGCNVVEAPPPSATHDSREGAPVAFTTPTPPSDSTPAQVSTLESVTVVPTFTARPQSEPSAPTLNYAIPAVARKTEFAAYRPIPVSIAPAVPPYLTELNSLSNPDLISALNPAQQEILEKNGFVVTPAPFAQIYEVFQQAKDQGQPIFVTTDALLHTYHILYDFALRDAEINHFFYDLVALTTEMLAQSQTQMTNTTGEAHQAATRNVAYFSVAASLLDQAFVPLSEVADLVAAELALIHAHQGFQVSPIFGFKEDYSQYVPRGHYTRNETFEQYFRAMMWYGRIGFRLRPGDEPELVEMGRMETRQAILIATALSTATVQGESALVIWDRIYEPTVFFVGRADDLTVYDYIPLIREVYGEVFNPVDLGDVGKLDNFIQQVATIRPARIISGYVTDQEDPTMVTQGFRFMGQRFVPDAFIFQQLVYEEVGTLANPRLLPSALDVASVFGSGRAYDISLNVYNQGQYENYAAQIDNLRAEFAALPPEQWHENLYWGWLHSIEPLLSPLTAGYPVFMQNSAWIDKDLHTYLGSWAELKHDTILYAKQSTTMVITSVGPEPQQVNGYVEPRPEVFARLAALASQTQRGLSERNLLSQTFHEKFTRIEELLLALTEMAKRELANQSLTEEEQLQIQSIGDTLEAITLVQDETLASAADGRLAIVADVHTDPNSDRVLEQAVGDAFVIWVIAPVDGQPTLTKGGVFSYYEFPWPVADRLTDETWQALHPKPDQPIWIQTFIVP